VARFSEYVGIDYSGRGKPTARLGSDGRNRYRDLLGPSGREVNSGDGCLDLFVAARS